MKEEALLREGGVKMAAMDERDDIPAVLEREDTSELNLERERGGFVFTFGSSGTSCFHEVLEESWGCWFIGCGCGSLHFVNNERKQSVKCQ